MPTDCKLITVAGSGSVPTESTGADYNKGAPLNAVEFDQIHVNLRAAIYRRALLTTNTFTGAQTISDATESTSVSTGCLILAGGLGLAKKLTGVNAAFSGAVSTGALTASGTIRSTTQVSPTSGEGIETFYDAAGHTGYVISYDRTGAAYKALNVNSSSTVFGINGSTIATLSSIGLTLNSNLTINESGVRGWLFDTTYSTGNLTIESGDLGGGIIFRNPITSGYTITAAALVSTGVLTASGNLKYNVTTASVPSNNWDVGFGALSNTQLQISMKGGDGTVRSVILNLT